VTDKRVPFQNHSVEEWDRESWVAPHLDAVLLRARRGSGKRFRSRLVELSARLVLASRGEIQPREQSEVSSGESLSDAVQFRVSEAGRAIEDIHLGSLVVDDIQDGSLVRRGEPALHRQVGVPLALNAGNWLYFSALKNLMRIPWSAVCECEAVDLAIDAMVLAHEGQAVDLGVDITKVEDEAVAEAVRASAERKTGALVAAAFGLGFLAAHADGEFDHELFREFQIFGKDWGVSLQMFDDLGAMRQSLRGLAPAEKLFEDLRNRRPCFFWTVVCSELPRSKHPEARDVIDLFLKDLSSKSGLTGVDSGDLVPYEVVQTWPSFVDFCDIVERYGIIERGMEIAADRTKAAVDRLTKRFSDSSCAQMSLSNELRNIGKISEDLSRAYL
jgi:geranylgeranyl pyrophosphate synthase